MTLRGVATHRLRTTAIETSLTISLIKGKSNQEVTFQFSGSFTTLPDSEV